MEAQPVLAQRSRGLPLLLALVADVAVAAPRVDSAATTESADLDAVLVELADHLVPTSGPQERSALYLAVLASRTDERLIERVLGVGATRARELVEWLSQLSFVESSAAGLFPHDVMRVALRARLRQDRPEIRTALLDAAVAHYLDEMSASADPSSPIFVNRFYFVAHSLTSYAGLISDDSTITTEGVAQLSA